MTRPKSPGDVLRPSIHQDVLGTGDTCPMPAQQCHSASRAATRQPCGNRLQPHATKNDREVTVWACAHQPHGTSRRAPAPYVPGQQLKKKETEPKPNVRAVQARNTRQVPLPHQRCASACAISCTNARWEICATAWSDHVGPAGPGNTCMAVHACNITAVKSRSHWRLPSMPRGLTLELGSQLLQLSSSPSCGNSAHPNLVECPFDSL